MINNDSDYSESDLLNELAAIRDMFPVPDKGSPLEQAWGAAMAHPMEISGFVAQAIAANASSVPEGYVIVPMKPTAEMIEAGDQVEDLYRRGRPETWGSVYRAMIRARPTPQVE